jgi:hypothetical protein
VGVFRKLPRENDLDYKSSRLSIRWLNSTPGIQPTTNFTRSGTTKQLTSILSSTWCAQAETRRTEAIQQQNHGASSRLEVQAVGRQGSACCTKSRSPTHALLLTSDRSSKPKTDSEARSETGASRINFCGSWHEQIHERLRIQEDLKKNLAT